jgi:hypothetical protein
MVENIFVCGREMWLAGILLGSGDKRAARGDRKQNGSQPPAEEEHFSYKGDKPCQPLIAFLRE